MLAETRPIGEEIDRLYAIRETIRDLKEKTSEQQVIFDALEEQVMQRLDQEGMGGARGAKASVAIGDEVVAKVEDWDAFWAFLHRNKFGHLMQRRVANAAYRELLTQRKKPIPGVVPNTIRKLSLGTV